MAKVIKEHFPDVKIMTGGIHPTTFPNEILTNVPEFDYLAIGEGELQILEIANRMEAGDLGDLSDIKGLAYRDEAGNIRINNERQVVDYEMLPMPAYDILDFFEFEVDLSNYFNPKGHVLKNKVSIFSERGCPFNCRFCDLHLMQGHSMRKFSPEKFLDQLKFLVNEKNLNYFSFMDDNLVHDNQHVINICKGIVANKLDIQFEVIGGYVNSFSDEVIENLVEAGMVSVVLNVEHGSEYIRNKIIRKPIKTEKIYTVMNKLRQYQLQVGSNWIMGFPEDTNETLQETYDLIDDIKPDRAAVGVLIPLPGTPIYEQCIKDDLFINKLDPKNAWRMPFWPHQDGAVIKPYKMTVDELVAWREKFMEIRYKYLGYHHPGLFNIPKGFYRDKDGIIRHEGR